jgi:hypothetical protein
MNTELAAIAERLEAAGAITAPDVLNMRAQVYGVPEVLADDLEAMAALDRAVPRARTPEWGEFFAEAMTDYVVRQQDPADYVDQAKSAWLMQTLGAADPLSADAALEALSRILTAANQVPADLVAYALARAKASVIGAGRIEAADVAALRRMVFAGGGEGSVGVGRSEAEALFDIDDACRAGANHPTWADFFAKAVADYLTSISPVHTESREDALRDEAWLESRESLSSFAAGLMRKPDIRGAMDEILHPYADEENEWRDAEAEIERSEADAATITDDEARWLIGRLGQGQLSDGERRLLSVLKIQASNVSPLLRPLLDAAPAPTPAEPDLTEVPVFGQRRAVPG